VALLGRKIEKRIVANGNRLAATGSFAVDKLKPRNSIRCERNRLRQCRNIDLLPKEDGCARTQVSFMGVMRF